MNYLNIILILTKRSVKKMSPRTKKQLIELKENRKQLLLESALKVFSEYGYNGATISMIAEEAEVSKGLLYNYFESKDVLLDELIRFGLEKASALLNNGAIPLPLDKKSFAKGLRAMIGLFNSGNQFWRLYCMLILQKNMSEKFEKAVGEFLKQYLGIYTDYFKKKKSSNPVAEAMLFGAVLDGLMFDMMVAPSHYPVDDVIDMVIKKFA